MKTADIAILGAGVALLGVAYYVWRKGGVQGAAEAAAGAVVDAAAGATAGVVYGVSDRIGIPRTNQTECERAIAEGRTWDASFACPAGTFLGSVWDRATGSGPSSSSDNQSPAESARLARYEYAGQTDNAGNYSFSDIASDPYTGMFYNP